MYISALANESVSVNIDEWNKTREYIRQMKEKTRYKYICFRCLSVGKYKDIRDEHDRLVCKCGSKTFFSGG